MKPPTRKRQHSAFHASTLMFSQSAGSAETDSVLSSKPQFHLDLWLYFTLSNWILDVGRSVAMLALPTEWIPLNRPGVAEYLCLLYNINTPLVLLKMLERSPRKLPPLSIHLGIISIVTGSSLHLVADAVTQRLILIGYQLHLLVRENPLMQNLKTSSLIEAFELLFYFDEILGHLMWYVPLYLVLFLLFSSSFSCRKEVKMPLAGWMLLAPSAAYYWFLITEGQTFILFIFTLFAMTATVMHQRRRGLAPDSNGLFMLYSFGAALLLVVVWVICLWNDNTLRKKHPGLIYVPQPRAIYTLRLQNYSWT